MAYSAPPTFADNSAPTAANLNVLSDDIEFLESIRPRHNLPAVVCTQDDSDWNVVGSRWRWQIIHQHNTLVINYSIGSANLNSTPDLFYNGSTLAAVINGGGDFSQNVGTHAYTCDLSGLGLTVGAVYDMHAHIDSTTGSTWTLNYMYEEGTQSVALPRQWTHGDVPTAAYMNAYSSGITNVYATWNGRKGYNLLVPLVGSTTTYSTWYGYGAFLIELTDYKLFRQYRWLHYFGDGTIIDPTGANANIVVDDNDAADGAVLDLDSTWIVVGSPYTVTGINGCIESDLVNA